MRFRLLPVPAQAQTRAEAKAKAPKKSAHQAANATCPSTTRIHGPPFLMIAGNQLRVAHQNKVPESHAQPKACFGELLRMISISGINAIHALADCDEGGKADHNSKALINAATDLRMNIAVNS